ncbi:MAG: threonine-phosphate decarboxylase CobD [Pseudophaeobacter sp. bin_em_oilr2.035]|uniref:threonine-phosphate decarboxylase n=1 Tax=Phaeobacter gallaeciensis TaxID=60890 RepID=A0ABD4XDP2_9RHOB|nr:threonine-phosphate decarboxylase CobD [Phaeobacter gallaeciensis]MDF1771795.1 threonine-phosphate decarboxylase CobD [Pseudophaeobacter sp. bin_em_oilr2.035]MDE4146194.1 threonine-phosphate decarboxylase CobD [Phaeobacter gallaeciensis]MDE4158921.1 threonine-phosphate decarboxylase CobD [Phaeobacter gallaeciensis]MDE4163044.1 threonine-phosphate decarboxylase CobD [Phaeobacter gallaeciensis]MDE4167274.1 threonine-phosphate decarboxylase CobD [Phaeobacter gallaeciensis]
MVASNTASKNAQRDHGGNLAAAMEQYGGTREDWIDLSTGINPAPYPLPCFTEADWSALPDSAASHDLHQAARRFWNVPEGAEILSAPGASSLIALAPALADPRWVRIETPTYNEHAAAFRAHGWSVTGQGPAEACVAVHPNNPTGRQWQAEELAAPFRIIDESFCDICPDQSLIHLAAEPGTLVLKSFGKFWGLAGLRLGFAIGDPELISRLSELQGPWSVSGPALKTGIQALSDTDWAAQTRARLAEDAARMDDMILPKGAELAGGTDLFRLYHIDDAAAWQQRLARAHIWSRIFPYSDTYLRLGLPPAAGWDRLEAAL